MDDPGSPPSHPTTLPLPTTFAGVAALATRPARWLFLGSVLTAALAGVVVAVSFEATWIRALEHAVLALPNQAEIRNGTLNWTGPARTNLHHSSFLGIVVDMESRPETGISSDATLALGRSSFALRSILGWVEFPYPPTLNLPLGRFEASGMLDAWKIPFLVSLGLGVAIALLLSWSVLATVYGVILRVLAAILGREMTLGIAWRLGAACLIPGALLMTAAIALYATRQLPLVGLLLAVPTHFVAGWIFAAGAFRHAAPPRNRARNPFLTDPPPPKTSRRGGATANPFQSS